MYRLLVSLFKPSPEARRNRFTTTHAAYNRRRHVHVFKRGNDDARLCLVVGKHGRLGASTLSPDAAILDLESVVDTGVVVAVLDAARIAKVDGELTHTLLITPLLQPLRKELQLAALYTLLLFRHTSRDPVMLRKWRKRSAFVGDGQGVSVTGAVWKTAMACFVEALSAAKVVDAAAGGDGRFVGGAVSVGVDAERECLGE